MTQITVVNEVFIDLGNSGVDVNIFNAQSMSMQFATPSGVYLRAGNYDIEAWHTNVFYVSGTVAEAGSLVELTADGNVPAEYNGKVLATNAVVITPEIFLSDAAIAGNNPTPPAPAPTPPITDGKVNNPLDVILLLHADATPWSDSSSYSRVTSELNAPQLDPIRKAFGTGSLQLIVNADNNGLLSEVTDDILDLQDESISFDARIRLDSLADKEHILFSVGNTDIFLEGKIVLDEVSGDEFVLSWKKSLAETDQVAIPLASGKFLLRPEVFQQLSFVYDSVKGHFAVFLDGERIGFVDASAFVSPAWTGINILAKSEPTHYIGIGVPADQPVDSSKQFAGHLDEVRLVVNQAIYDTDSTVSAVYPWPWPNPIV